MSLSHKDVQDILRLLDDTDYIELTLETDNFTLTLKRSDDGEGWMQESKTDTGYRIQDTGIASLKSAEEKSEPAPGEQGLLDVRAPIVGTFYRAPKPGADPFVEIGSQVSGNTVIAIIEVMKLMNSIPAGVVGEVVDILAGDAAFVEKGQLLMRIRPPAT
jgi:acetyl-CoA carboxylase biotin carboxyl carrier protein